MTKYIIMLQYRNYQRKVMQKAHTAAFDTIEEAQPVMSELCNHHKAMGWLVELEIPAFIPPLKSVN